MINLSKISTRAPKNLDKNKIKKETAKIAERIGELAEVMKAEKKHSILVVFQGMDSSGKDGATEHVFSATSPSHVAVKGYKKPTEEEFAHDFLWRVDAINAWEKLLIADNNTTILKFYMHLSHEKQGEKLQERIDNPEKNWKHNPGDWEERKLWDRYREVYEDTINRSEVPWIIAPVDQRWYRNYFIASKVLEAMENMNMKLPVIKDGKA